MDELKFGIVGTGFIAGVVANSIGQSTKGRLTAISSRKQETADAFASEYNSVTPVVGVEALLACDNAEAIYIATPTTTKEQIALAAIAADKHVLVDKPFLDHASCKRMTDAAASKGVVFMDATHFVHHPRTEAIQIAIPEKIGTPKSLHTIFYFPFSESTNIRFDTSLEPTGAFGDMAWYSMRAIVEYLQPKGIISTVVGVVERDSSTNAVIRAEGLISFESGEVSTFDVGYTADTAIMDLELLGTNGVIMMDDFVLDWSNSFAFKNPDIKVGYVHRTGMANRNDFNFIETSAKDTQDALMIDHFADLVSNGHPHARESYVTASLKTQQYLDAVWASLSS